MPWQEVVTMELRQQFVQDALRRVVPVTELCAAYGISRKTGYKFLARYDALGSRRPRRSVPPASSLARGARSGAARAPARGPPPPSVLGAAEAAPPRGPSLARRALARALHRRALLPAPGAGHRPPARPPPRARGTARWRRWRPRMPCGPPTTRASSSWAMGSTASRSPWPTATAACSWPVRPSPAPSWSRPGPSSSASSASTACPGASALITACPSPPRRSAASPSLAVWWIRLGILPDLTEPGSPHQNGRHERMHLTLKRECTRPPQRTRRQQQRRFDTWRQEYNTLRPHEALGDATPASAYTPSPRPYPARLPPLEYPGHYEVRRVSRNGGIRWHKQWVNVSQTLGEESVGLRRDRRRRMGRLLRPAPLGPIPRAHSPHRGRARPALPPAPTNDCHLCPRT